MDIDLSSLLDFALTLELVTAAYALDTKTTREGPTQYRNVYRKKEKDFGIIAKFLDYNRA